MGTSFVNFFFFSSMSLYAEKLTGTVAFAGYLSLVYSATALVIRPVSGIFADKYGRAKTIAIGGILCAVACMLYSFTTVLALLLVIRILNGIGLSMASTSAGAAIPDVVPSERLAEGIGLFGLHSTISQALGPIIALALIGDGELSSFNRLFYISALFCMVSFISGCLIKYERVKKAEKQAVQPPVTPLASSLISSPDLDSAPVSVSDSSPDAALASMSTPAPPAALIEPGEAEGKTFFGFERQVLGPAVVMMLYFFGVSSILTFLTVYAKSRGFQIESLGWFFFVSAGGVLFSRLVFGRIVDRRGGDVVVIPGLAVMAACLFFIPVMPSLPMLICLGLPYGLASGIVGPSINAMMFKRCSVKRRGTVSAAYYAAIDIGITLGAPIMGWAADLVGFTAVYWLSAALLVTNTIVYLLFVSDRKYYKKSA